MTVIEYIDELDMCGSISKERASEFLNNAEKYIYEIDDTCLQIEKSIVNEDNDFI